jgi:RimJ/RimL family protein N-acetyltransferase
VDWRNRSAEAGIFVGVKSLWGRGHGTDAMNALVGWGFDELNLHRIWLRVFADNPRAVRSYEKVGFRVEGRLRQDRYHRGQYSDTLVMGLLSEERSRRA